jgi:hypothetical protein
MGRFGQLLGVTIYKVRDHLEGPVLCNPLGVSDGFSVFCPMNCTVVAWFTHLSLLLLIETQRLVLSLQCC